MEEKGQSHKKLESMQFVPPESICTPRVHTLCVFLCFVIEFRKSLPKKPHLTCMTVIILEELVISFTSFWWYEFIQIQVHYKITSNTNCYSNVGRANTIIHLVRFVCGIIFFWLICLSFFLFFIQFRIKSSYLLEEQLPPALSFQIRKLRKS